MPNFTSQQIADVCTRLMESAGASPEDARVVGEHLAQANLYGHDSHGMQNVLHYMNIIHDGSMKPRAKWSVVRDAPATALIDGQWGLGQVVATEAMKLAIGKAKSMGVGSVGIFNCSHIGRLGAYPMMAAEQGMIGMVYANSEPSVAPLGGMARMLGTNPMSYALPAGEEKTLMVDFASAAVAEGKIRVALYKGASIPQGWILDKDGMPSTNPADLYGPPLPPEGMNIVGAQLPAAAHKGYGLAMVVDIIGGALTGAGCDGDVKIGNGVFMQAINIESFGPIDRYKARVDKLIRDIRNSPKAPGSTEILIPGEPELRTAEKRTKEGIPISEMTWAHIVAYAKQHGVDIQGIVPGTQ